MLKKYPKLEPEAKKAIDACAKKEYGLIMMSAGVTHQREEAETLYDLLAYASDKGVHVQLVPKEKK